MDDFEVTTSEFSDFLLSHVIPAYKRKFDDRFNSSTSDIYLTELHDLQLTAEDQLKLIWYWPNIFNNQIAGNNANNEIESKEILYYHYTSYLVNTISFFDYCLKLVNHTCQIGMNNRDINFNQIAKNTIWKNDKIITVLQKLNSHFEEIRIQRNKKVHQGKVSNDLIDKIELFTERPFLENLGLFKDKNLKKFFNTEKKRQLEAFLKKINEFIAINITLFKELLNEIARIAKKEIEVINLRQI